jgi:hypothetical protein
MFPKIWRGNSPQSLGYHARCDRGAGGRGRALGKLTVYQARQLLGITSRYEMDGFLKSHGVLLPDTLEQVLADSETAITFSR